MNNDYNRSPQEVLEELGSCPTGLTEQQAGSGWPNTAPTNCRRRRSPPFSSAF